MHQHGDPTLDDDLAAWNAPGWRQLDLDAKDVEVIAHLSMRPDASEWQRAHDLWRYARIVRAIANLQAACGRINCAASAATGKLGKPGTLIEIPGQIPAPGPRPQMRLGLLADEPAIDVRHQHPAITIALWGHVFLRVGRLITTTVEARGGRRRCLARLQSRAVCSTAGRGLTVRDRNAR